MKVYSHDVWDWDIRPKIEVPDLESGFISGAGNGREHARVGPPCEVLGVKPGLDEAILRLSLNQILDGNASTEKEAGGSPRCARSYMVT